MKHFQRPHVLPVIGLILLTLSIAFAGAATATGLGNARLGDHSINATPQSQGICDTAGTGNETSGHMMGGAMMSGSPIATMPMMGEFDLMFIDMMTIHHQGAISMAEIALDRAEHQEIRDLAQTIVTTQQAEVDQMQAWRESWYPGAGILSMDHMVGTMSGMMNTMPSSMATPGMGMSNQFGLSGMMDPHSEQASLCATSGDFDLAFLGMMIPHHQSGVMMSQVALANATHPELKELARQIIESQQAEIAQMETWRSEWSTPATPSSDTATNQVDVTLTEFAVNSSLTTFTVGQTYHFVVTNNGAIPHEFMILPRMNGTGKMDMEMLDKMALVMIPAEDLLPGVTLSADVTFTEAAPAGKLEMVCAVPGHYDAGMKLPITVTE